MKSKYNDLDKFLSNTLTARLSDHDRLRSVEDPRRGFVAMAIRRFCLVSKAIRRDHF